LNTSPIISSTRRREKRWDWGGCSQAGYEEPCVQFTPRFGGVGGGGGGGFRSRVRAPLHPGDHWRKLTASGDRFGDRGDQVIPAIIFFAPRGVRGAGTRPDARSRRVWGCWVTGPNRLERPISQRSSRRVGTQATATVPCWSRRDVVTSAPTPLRNPRSDISFVGPRPSKSPPASARSARRPRSTSYPGRRKSCCSDVRGGEGARVVVNCFPRLFGRPSGMRSGQRAVQGQQTFQRSSGGVDARVHAPRGLLYRQISAPSPKYRSARVGRAWPAPTRTSSHVNIALGHEFAHHVRARLEVNVREVIDVDSAATKPFRLLSSTRARDRADRNRRRHRFYLAWKMRRTAMRRASSTLPTRSRAMPEYVVDLARSRR